MRGVMLVLGISAVAAAIARAADVSDELAPPVPVLAGGQPVDTQRIGHAAPFFGDFDGDGLADLLVGEFYQGRLRVYRNVGTRDEPVFGDYTWFNAGAELGRVPTG